MLGSLHEVRPGRFLYVETSYGNPEGEFAGNNLVALLIHGAMCHHSQVACSLVVSFSCNTPKGCNAEMADSLAAVC